MLKCREDPSQNRSSRIGIFRFQFICARVFKCLDGVVPKDQFETHEGQCKIVTYSVETNLHREVEHSI